MIEVFFSELEIGKAFRTSRNGRLLHVASSQYAQCASGTGPSVKFEADSVVLVSNETNEANEANEAE